MSDTPPAPPKPAVASAEPSPEELTTTDARGRVIKLRILDPGDTLDLLEAAGPASGNEGYMRYAMVVCSIAEIDGLPLPMVKTRDHIRAAGKRIGNDGIVAATRLLFEDAAKADGEAAETAKN